MEFEYEPVLDIHRADALFEVLGRISKEQAKQALDAKGVDPKVGIVIAEYPEIQPIDFEGQKYEFFSARVLPKKEDGSQPFVTPHAHHKGVEPYLFYGRGEMNFGTVSADGKEALWRTPQQVIDTSKVVIQEGEVHSFRNTGDRPVDFSFSCPRSHLTDFSTEHPEGDRYIVKDLKNGIPPHYLRE